MCQGLNVVPVQVGGGLVQGQNPAVQAEGFSQSQTDDQGGQNLHIHAKIRKTLTRPTRPSRTQNTWYLLTSAAAPPHVQSGVALHHDHSVVVDPPLDARRRIIIHVRPDLDVLDIWRMVARESDEMRPEKLSVHYLQLEGKRTLTPVGAAPQVSDNLVDLIHLHAVEFHDGSEKKTGKKNS